MSDFEEFFKRLENEVLEEGCCECEYEEGYDYDFSDMVQALKSDSSLIAIREDGKLYEYCDGLLEIDKGTSKEWASRITPRVDYELISSMYSVIPREQWEDISSQELLIMIANEEVDNNDKLRVVSNLGTTIDLSLSAIKMLTLREILDYDWQILL